MKRDPPPHTHTHTHKQKNKVLLTPLQLRILWICRKRKTYLVKNFIDFEKLLVATVSRVRHNLEFLCVATTCERWEGCSRPDCSFTHFLRVERTSLSHFRFLCLRATLNSTVSKRSARPPLILFCAIDTIIVWDEKRQQRTYQPLGTTFLLVTGCVAFNSPRRPEAAA